MNAAAAGKKEAKFKARCAERQIEGHIGFVNSLDFFPSPDGLKLVSAGVDGTARIWDVTSGSEIEALEGHVGDVKAVAFSPDGKRIVTGAWMARIWDAESGELLDTLRGHESQVSAVSFVGDAETLVTGSLDGVKRWDLRRRDRQLVFEAHAFWAGLPCSPMSLCRDRRLLAAARRRGEVTLWNLRTGEELATFAGHTNSDGGAGRVWSVQFSSDGKRLACATADGRAKIWDVATQTVLHELAGSRIVAFSPDGEVLATAGPAPSTKIRLWNASMGNLIRTLPGIGTKRLNAIVFSPDGTCLASGGESLTSRNFAIWNSETGEEIAAPKGHMAATDSIAFSADGRLCCTGGGDGTIILWDTRTWTESATSIEGRHVARVKCVAFSADGGTLASASGDGLIKLWHVNTGGHLLTLPAHDAAVESVEFSRDGQSLVSYGADGKIRVWQAANGHDLSETP